MREKENLQVGVCASVCRILRSVSQIIGFEMVCDFMGRSSSVYIKETIGRLWNIFMKGQEVDFVCGWPEKWLWILCNQGFWRLYIHFNHRSFFFFFFFFNLEHNCFAPIPVTWQTVLLINQKEHLVIVDYGPWRGMEKSQNFVIHGLHEHSTATFFSAVRCMRLAYFNRCFVQDSLTHCTCGNQAFT